MNLAGDPLAAGLAPLPGFAVELASPVIAAFLAGNTGVAGFTSHAASAPGPHVVVIALTHGNEIAGGIVVAELLRERLRPACGRLTMGFANLAAFARFDPADPTATRFIDEDLNRVWDEATLDGPRQSCELTRAREMRPLIDSADVLLDLHSMLWPSDPLILCGETARGRALALDLGQPPLVVADSGHASGRRMIDYRRFADPASGAVANLVEAGQHWHPATVETTRACVAALLRRFGMLPVADPAPAPAARAYAQVTATITANTAAFSFMRAYRGGEVIRRRNTLIALDGEAEIRTPYDDCLLVMPTLRPGRGHTAVRLARVLPA